VIGSLALAAPLGADAADPCTAFVPTNYDPANPIEHDIYVQEVAIDGAAVYEFAGLCLPSGVPTAMDDHGVPQTIDVVADGTPDGRITVTFPGGFVGLAHITLTFTEGAASHVFDLYSYVGTPATQWNPGAVAAQSAAVGTPALFAMSGLTFPTGTSGSVVAQNPSSQFSVGYDAATPGVIVTALEAAGGPIEIQALVGNGIQARIFRLVLWVGVPVPTTVVFGPQPPPVQIQPLGTGYFPISAFAPAGSDCEINIDTDPDIQITTEPPRMDGVTRLIAIEVRENFTGILTVNYALACTPPDSDTATEMTYRLALYVGVPLPVAAAPALAATGVDPLPLLFVTFCVLALGVAFRRVSRSIP
jgi:hypothetical protein